MTSDLAPHLAKIKAAAIEVISAVREVIDRCSQQNAYGLALRDAHDALGLTYNEAALLHAPMPVGYVADAVLEACRHAGFSPFDWRDIVAPQRAVPLTLATPGDRAVISPNHAEEQAAVNARWQQKLEGEVQQNEIAKAAERQQRATAPMAPRPAPVALASAFADRASLAVDD